MQNIDEASQTWLSALSSTKQACSTLEETQVNRRFGPALAECSKTQIQISSLCDTWLNHLQVYFASFLLGKIVASTRIRILSCLTTNQQSKNSV